MASYADIAAKGPSQSAEEAAAPPVPEIETTTEASTSSLVDVDHPSVRTVPSDFADQDIKTDTQAKRLEAEERAERARAEKDLSKKSKRADTLLSRILNVHCGSPNAQAAAAANVLCVVGISSFLGYKAWGLYEKGIFSWKHAGIGAGVMGLVAAAEVLAGKYVIKTKNKKE